jgi:hypothetical protein
MMRQQQQQEIASSHKVRSNSQKRARPKSAKQQLSSGPSKTLKAKAIQSYASYYQPANPKKKKSVVGGLKTKSKKKKRPMTAGAPPMMGQGYMMNNYFPALEGGGISQTTEDGASGSKE